MSPPNPADSDIQVEPGPFHPEGFPSAAEEALFSELARRIEPRSRGGPSGIGPAEFLISCARDSLTPEEQHLLARLDNMQRSPGSERTQRLEIRVPLPLLESLARDHPSAALLLFTVQVAARPPAPPRLMGILNVTPDSFSDGGAFLAPEQAIEQGLKLVADGAEMLDVGGESTRPGSSPVSPKLEQERTLPVIEGLRRETNAAISIDTRKASVARAALAAGASIVNDVSAGRFDEEMLSVVAEHDAYLILMHMQNEPRNMQKAPRYEDVVTEVTAHLRDRVSACLKAGIALTKIAVDPGIGFGKRLKDNLELVRSVPELRSLGLPVVLGLSRKSFLGELTGRTKPADRDTETLAAISCARGADIHRVHDVEQAKRALAVASAIRGEADRERTEDGA